MPEGCQAPLQEKLQEIRSMPAAACKDKEQQSRESIIVNAETRPIASPENKRVLERESRGEL